MRRPTVAAPHDTLITRRVLITGAGATALGAAVAAAAQTRSVSTPSPAGSEGASPQQWALVVDQKRCAKKNGCRACIEACHTGHAVTKAKDPRHAVKWVWKARFDDVFPEHVHPRMPTGERREKVVVTCNHCSSSPCTRVCPTRATWKRPDGIVAQDPHRCIGCRYCMAACPYGSRSFNWENPVALKQPSTYPQRSAGVVEKCTFCVERLDLGLAPLCVEACSKQGKGALSYGNLSDPNSEVSRLLAKRQVIRRKPELGTLPNVYYLV